MGRGIERPGFRMKPLPPGPIRRMLRPFDKRLDVAELAWFLLVGGGAALALAAVTAVMISLRTGAPDWLVAGLCYAAFIGPVYLLHRRLSFRSDAAHVQAFPRYLAVQASAIVLVSALSWLCYSVLGVPVAIGSVAVLGLSAGLNFVLLKLWAFAARSGRRPAPLD